MRSAEKAKRKTTSDRYKYVAPIWFFFSKIPLPVIVFIAVALVAGSVYIKNVGSFSGPDLYQAHYRASLATATGQIFSQPVGRDYSKVQLITGEEKYFNSGSPCLRVDLVSSVIVDPLDADDKEKCIREHDKTLSERDVTIQATIQYPFLSYVPQAVGLKIGMLANMEPVDAQTLARYMNLIVYILFIVASILIIPRGKWLVAVLASLPTSLFLASSLSADALSIAWSMLFVAYVLRLYVQKTSVTLKQAGLLFLLGTGLFMLKIAYAPIILLILALKPKTITFGKKLGLFGVILCIGLTFYVTYSSNWGSLNATVDTSRQLDILLQHIPQAILAVVLNILYLPMRLFEAQPIYIVITILLLTVLFIRIKNTNPVKPTGIKQAISLYYLQVLGLLAFVGSIGLTCSALLLTWTDIGYYGWTDIQGFQGRYMLPLLPLLLLAYYLPHRNPTKNTEKV